MRWLAPFLRPAKPLAKPVAKSIYQLAADSDRPVVMVSLLLADAQTTTRVLARHRQHKSHKLVFVTTAADPAAFRAAGVTFEMLPSPEMVRAHGDLGDWQLYLTERWRLLRSKWQPQMLVMAGADLPKYLQECGLNATHGPSGGNAN